MLHTRTIPRARRQNRERLGLHGQLDDDGLLVRSLRAAPQHVVEMKAARGARHRNVPRLVNRQRRRAHFDGARRRARRPAVRLTDGPAPTGGGSVRRRRNSGFPPAGSRPTDRRRPGQHRTGWFQGDGAAAGTRRAAARRCSGLGSSAYAVQPSEYVTPGTTRVATHSAAALMSCRTTNARFMNVSSTVS